MKLLIFIFAFYLTIYLSFSQKYDLDDDDDDFAEFDDPDEFIKPEKPSSSDVKEEKSEKSRQKISSPESPLKSDEIDDDGLVEDESDFEHFEDPDEFEGWNKDSSSQPKKPAEEKLKIANIPAHLRTNWESYYSEMLTIAGLFIYFANFLVGKSKNYRLAQAWLNAHRDILEDNFSIVGDDGVSAEASSGTLLKETESLYSMWCSGRVACEGMLIELRFLKRQDIISLISRIFKPASDQIVVKVYMDDMDSYVFAAGNKKTCSRLQKEMTDLNNYCTEKKGADRYGLPSGNIILSEIGEASQAILDSKVQKCFQDFNGCIDYIHFSDQFSGPQPPDDGSQQQAPKPSDIKKTLIFCFNIPGKGRSSISDVEMMTPLLKMVLHCIDKVFRFRLSKEGKQKSKRNRDKIAEDIIKMTHQQRQEAAQTRREEKIRADKEKMLEEDDPDKQRKYERQQARLEVKRKHPKAKMMKIRM